MAVFFSLILSGFSEWKLNGQTITMTLPLHDTVAVIKTKLNDELGMPPGKQKLQIENIFLKDSNSLGFYNITPGEETLFAFYFEPILIYW
jgi:hypothetical protein